MSLLKDSTYQQKLKWLLIASIPILLLCYKVAVSKTIEEYRLYNLKQQNSSGDSTDAGKISKIESKAAQYHTIINRYQLDTTDHRKNLLSFVTRFCRDNDLQLKEYRPLGITKQNGLKLLTRSFSVEGSFHECLRLVYALETEQQSGRIASVHYKSYIQKEGKKNNIQLLCTVYVQNIIAP